MLRAETERVGAVLIFDEIKTAFRLAIGGAVARYEIRPAPDLVVLGKALANGFPLAVVGGRADLMPRPPAPGSHRRWRPKGYRSLLRAPRWRCSSGRMCAGVCIAWAPGCCTACTSCSDAMQA